MKKVNSKHFTLVELLAMFAIVLILMSLLQPSLKKIIASSYVLKCSNNLRQAGVANALYADDFDDFYVPQWMVTPGDPISGFKTRWGHLKEFRSYAEWDRESGKHWLMPHDKACPEAVVKAKDFLSEGNHSYFLDPPIIKVFYTYGHLAIYGNKFNRGMHRYWLQSPSQLGNAGECFQKVRISSVDVDPRHDFRSNILFFDGHIELFEDDELKGPSDKPWKDSNGLTLTDINQKNALN